jgi:HSP20 family molecular chaperone IbpA
VEKGILTISGEVVDALEVENSSFLHRELFFGTFSRSIKISRPVDSANASAKFKQNILTISLPKTIHSAPIIVDVTPAD